MNFTNPIKTAAALASVTVFAVCAPAQDDAAAEKSTEQPAAEQAAAGEDAADLAPIKVADKFFYPLLRCKRAVGSVQVLRPTTKDWVDAQVGRYYPLGSQVRVAGTETTAPEAVFEFGEKSSIKITSNAEFATAPIQIGDRVRTLVLKKGRVALALPLQLKEGLFKVEAPNFTCENLAGESWFDYSSAADGDEAVVRCVTGSMALKGPHYKFPRLVAANQLRVATTGRNLFTSLTGESGDCKAQLDQGILAEHNFETGEMVENKKTLDFSLSPQCSIKIFRAKSKAGHLAVSMMTFNPAGEMKNRVAFTEGRANVNSGELVVSTKVADADKKAAAKADEETETVEVPAPKKAVKDDEDEPAPAPKKAVKDDEDEPAPAPKKDEKKDEKKDDDDFI